MAIEAARIRGACLCGAVAFRIWGPFERFVLCHCSRCRKATASVHAANLFTAPDHVEWLHGVDLIRRYQVPEARSFSKCFCIQCGSALPYVSRNGAHLIVPAGCWTRIRASSRIGRSSGTAAHAGTKLGSRRRALPHIRPRVGFLTPNDGVGSSGPVRQHVPQGVDERQGFVQEDVVGGTGKGAKR